MDRTAPARGPTPREIHISRVGGVYVRNQFTIPNVDHSLSPDEFCVRMADAHPTMVIVFEGER